jgi:hypothetical protein
MKNLEAQGHGKSMMSNEIVESLRDDLAALHAAGSITRETMRVRCVCRQPPHVGVHPVDESFEAVTVPVASSGLRDA